MTRPVLLRPDPDSPLMKLARECQQKPRPDWVPDWLAEGELRPITPAEERALWKWCLSQARTRGLIP